MVTEPAANFTWTCLNSRKHLDRQKNTAKIREWSHWQNYTYSLKLTIQLLTARRWLCSRPPADFCFTPAAAAFPAGSQYLNLNVYISMLFGGKSIEFQHFFYLFLSFYFSQFHIVSKIEQTTNHPVLQIFQNKTTKCSTNSL